MRIYRGLTFIAVLMAFLAGYLSLNLRLRGTPQAGISSQVTLLKRDFQSQESPLGKISPLAVYSIRDVFQLLSPGSVLPQTHKFKFDEMRILRSYSKTCKKDLSRAISKKHLNETLAKEFTWEQFKCNQLKDLPTTYFERPPFMSPFGGSYVALALELNDKFRSNSEWITAHLPYLHASELTQALEKIEKVPLFYQIVGQLDDTGLKGVVNKDPLVLSSKFVLIEERESTPESPGGLSTVSTYKVYLRPNWDQFLSMAPLIATNMVDSSCLQKDGQLCWIANEKYVFQRFRNPTLLLFMGSILLTLLSVVLIFKRIQQQKIQEERKRFALQTLTHELRTPITSLVISTEAMLSDYDSMPKAFQPHLLRLANDTQRLRRLAEVSQQYLSSHPGNKIVQFKFSLVTSINNFVDAVLEPYQDKIQVESLSKDQQFELDPYWVGVCLKNLVDNALIHGESPVTVSVLISGKTLELTVTDHGDFSTISLLNVGEPFSKGRASAGLGLGLSIVKTIIEDMKGEFIFEQKPTRFGFRIVNQI